MKKSVLPILVSLIITTLTGIAAADVTFLPQGTYNLAVPANKDVYTDDVLGVYLTMTSDEFIATMNKAGMVLDKDREPDEKEVVVDAQKIIWPNTLYYFSPDKAIDILVTFSPPHPPEFPKAIVRRVDFDYHAPAGTDRVAWIKLTLQKALDKYGLPVDTKVKQDCVPAPMTSGALWLTKSKYSDFMKLHPEAPRYAAIGASFRMDGECAVSFHVEMNDEGLQESHLQWEDDLHQYMATHGALNKGVAPATF